TRAPRSWDNPVTTPRWAEPYVFGSGADGSSPTTATSTRPECSGCGRPTPQAIVACCLILGSSRRISNDFAVTPSAAPKHDRLAGHGERSTSMRQLVMNMSGVTVARMPRPVVGPGTVLIRVHYSLVSVGTEVAPLRPASVSAPDTPAIERSLDRARLLERYF